MELCDTMGSRSAYKVPAGFFFSFPVQCAKGTMAIKTGLVVSKEVEASIVNAVKQIKAQADDALKRAGFAQTPVGPS